MALAKILLREEVENLGGRGDIVKVRPGYARNFLVPKGKAFYATKFNVEKIEREQAELLKVAAEEKAAAETRAAEIGAVSLRFERKSGDGGHLFGSVTSIDIADALKEKGIEIDRRKIQLKDHIKETGNYSIAVKLHREVALNLDITVAAEGAVEEVAAPAETVAEETAEAAE